MHTYRVVIEENGLSDIQHAMDYYELQQTSLGKRFFTVIQKHIELISKNQLPLTPASGWCGFLSPHLVAGECGGA